MSAAPFADSADEYLLRGWQPIPMTRPMPDRGSPPSGFTGGMNGVAGVREVSLWKTLYPGPHNIGIRMGKREIGIDVDDYDTKPGGRTIKEMEASCGQELPKTYRSSSRLDTSPASGIKVYRLEDGVDETQFPSSLPGVDIIRASHRYAITAPSVNEKTEAEYWWLNEATGELTQTPPDAASLPVLPKVFVDYLMEYRREEKRRQKEAEELRPLPDSTHEVCGIVRRATEYYVERHVAEGVSCHDSMRDGALRVAGLARDGHQGWEKALGIFKTTLLKKRANDGNVREETAEDEWDRIYEGALRLMKREVQLTECLCLASPELMEWVSAPVTVEIPGVGLVAVESRPGEVVGTVSVEDSEQLLANKLYEQREIARETYETKRAAAAFREPVGQGIASFLAVEPDMPSYHVDGLWPHGGMVILQASKKWGKSTLVKNTVGQTIRETMFLGRYAVTSPFKCALVIDLELTERQFWDYWTGVGLTDDQMTVWRLRGSVGSMAIRDAWVRREITRRMKDVGADLVVLDPVGPALRACGFAENSNDDFGRFLDLFDEMRLEAGVTAALIPHHMGHSGEHGRGASVLGDKADAIWTGTYAKPGDTSGPRFLGAQGRMPEVESVELAYDESTRRLWIPEIARTRASVAQVDKQERRDAEFDRKVAEVRAVLTSGESFTGNRPLKEKLGVTWSGTVLGQIKKVLVDEGLTHPGDGWGGQT